MPRIPATAARVGSPPCIVNNGKFFNASAESQPALTEMRERILRHEYWRAATSGGMISVNIAVYLDSRTGLAPRSLGHALGYQKTILWVSSIKHGRTRAGTGCNR